MRRGNKSAFDQLFKLYYKTCVAFAMHFIDYKDDAEDVVQEVFAKLWVQWDKVELIDSMKDYLFISVRNNCLTYLRDRERLTGQMQEFPSEEEVTSHLIEEETNRLLLQAIGMLPARSAEVIILGLQGKKLEEIAQQMGISIHTVKTLKYDGIQKLKYILQNLYPLILIALQALKNFVESSN